MDQEPMQIEGQYLRTARWVWGFGLMVMAVTSLPYVVGFLNQGELWRFTGFVFGVDDGNSYIAKMLSGSQGAWLFRTPYTPFPQRGVIAFLPYILLGKLVPGPGYHTSLVILFHVSRLGAGILAIKATADFLGMFLPGSSHRWAVMLAVLGGGLGWLLVILGQDQWLGSLPLDFHSPESFGFLSLYGLPHLSLARALMLWGFCSYLSQVPDSPGPASFRSPGKVRRFIPWLLFRHESAGKDVALKGGLMWLLLGLAQPLTVVIAWAVLAAHLAFRSLTARTQSQHGRVMPERINWELFRRAFWMVVLSSPIVGYTLVSFNLDPFLLVWTSQNRILSPHPLHYLVAYGLVLPWALVGAWSILRENSWLGTLLVVWVGLLPLLAYAPYNLQRRLLDGGWVALVGLAVYGWSARRRKSAPHRISGMVAFSLLFPSTALLLAGGVLTGGHLDEPVYRPAAEVAVFERLAAEASPGQVVLADFSTGNALPAWAPLRVVIGHGPESAFLARLEPQVANFYRGMMADDTRDLWLDTLQIDFVFWGPAEKSLGGWDPGVDSKFTLIAQEGDYAVYRVQP